MPLTSGKFSLQTTTNTFVMYLYMHKKRAKMHEGGHAYHIGEVIFSMH